MLLLDAGNTRLKWAITDSERGVFDTGVVEYAALEGFLEGGRYLSGEASLLGEASRNLWFERPREVLVSSVASEQRNQLISRVCKSQFGVIPEFVGVASAACGVVNEYQALDRLGVDRWVAAIGVAGEVGVNRVIIDAGTAVTVDLLRADNTFQGGVILPGAKLMHDSLVGQTAGIFSQHGMVSSVCGKTTQDCVNAGAYFGLAGAIERVIEEMCLSCSNEHIWQVFVCGGDAHWLSRMIRCEMPLHEKPSLIFDGLINLSKFRRADGAAD